MCAEPGGCFWREEEQGLGVFAGHQALVPGSHSMAFPPALDQPWCIPETSWS